MENHPLTLPTYADNLAEFAADLRSFVFRSQSAAARHFECHSTTISRYENEKTTPPLFYLVKMAQLITDRVNDFTTEQITIQQHLLREINQAIHWCYEGQKLFSDWNEFVHYGEAITPTESSSPAMIPATAPAPPRHFFGRAEQVETVAQQIINGQGESVLVIQGMGGIGKSVFVKQLAVRLQTEFPDNVFWANIADHDGQAGPIFQTWARLCGQELPERGDTTAFADLVRGMLANRQKTDPLIVILDDLREKWIPTGLALRAAIPENTPLLITTREVRVAQSLGATGLIHLDVLNSKDSVHLLETISQNSLEDKNAQLVAEWCGNVPLALNLAALVAAQEGADWLLKALQSPDNRLDIFELDHPRAKEESVRLTFAISYNALKEKHPETARLFRLLGVFATTSIRAEMLAEVAYTTDKQQVHTVQRNRTEQELRRLVLWGLTTRGRAPGTYQIHPLLQSYASELLEEMRESSTAFSNHLVAYLMFAQTHAHPSLESINILEADLPEFLLAAQRVTLAGSPEDVLALCKILIQDSELLNTRGYYHEAITLLHLALSRGDGNLKQHNDTPWIMNKLAFFHIQLGEYDQAWQEGKKAYQLAVEQNNVAQQADSLLYQGYVSLQDGEYLQALQLWQEELVLRYQIEDSARIANCLNSLGAANTLLGNYAEATATLAQSAQLYAEIHDRLHFARARTNQGVCLLYLGKYEEARHIIDQALKDAEQMQNQELIARNLLNKGVLQGYCGEFSAAQKSLQASLSLWGKLDNRSTLMLVNNALAEVFLALGEMGEANRLLQVVQDYLSQKADLRVETDFLAVFSALHYIQGNFIDAQKTFIALQTLAEESGHTYLLVQSKLGLSQALFANGDTQDARFYAQEAYKICQNKQLTGVMPRALAYLAQNSLAFNEETTALQYGQDTLKQLEKQGNIHGSKVEIYWIIAQVFQAFKNTTEQARIIEKAKQHIYQLADQILEPVLRASFLSHPEHQKVLLWNSN